MRAVGAKIVKGTMLYILITEAMPWLSDKDKQSWVYHIQIERMDRYQTNIE